MYNAALRRFPPALYEVLQAGDNLFATTIAVLVGTPLPTTRVRPSIPPVYTIIAVLVPLRGRKLRKETHLFCIN